VGAKLRVVVCLVELSVFLLYFFGGIFPSLLLNIMKRSSPASFEKKKRINSAIKLEMENKGYENK